MFLSAASDVISWITTSGSARTTASTTAARSRPSATTGSAPSSRSSVALLAVRVMPTTSCPRATSSGTSRRPSAPWHRRERPSCHYLLWIALLRNRLLEERLQPRERRLEPLGQPDGLERVRERHRRAPARRLAQVVAARRPAPPFLAAPPVLERVLRAHALDHGDLQPRVAPCALGPHTRARPHPDRRWARDRPVDEEVVGKRLVPAEIVEVAEDAPAWAIDMSSDRQRGHHAASCSDGARRGNSR